MEHLNGELALGMEMKKIGKFNVFFLIFMRVENDFFFFLEMARGDDKKHQMLKEKDDELI